MPHKQKNSKPIRHRIGTILSELLTAVVVLAVLAIVFTQTGFFRDWLRAKIVSTANESINGELAIEGMDGNVFNHLTLRGVSLVMDNDTVARISSLYLQYNPWKLVNQTVQVDSVAIDSLYLLALQRKDSSWNLAKVVLSDTATGQVDTSAAEFGYDIVVDDLVLNSGAVDIVGSDSLIPRRIEDLDIHVGGKFADGMIEVGLYDLRLHTLDPDFRISHAELRATVDSAAYRFESVTIETPMNRITGDAEYHPDNPVANSATISADSLTLSEFRRFIPSVMKDPLPLVFLFGELTKDSLWVTVSAQRGEQRIDIEADAYPLSVAYDSLTSGPLSYLADAVFDRVASEDWVTDTTVRVTLNGSVAIEGSGMEPEQARVSVEADFERSLIDIYRLSAFWFDIDYAEQAVSGAFKGEGEFGKIEARGEVGELFDSVSYDLDLDIAGLNLARLGFGDTLQTDINLSAQTSGKGYTRETARGYARMVLRSSRVLQYDLDSGYIATEFGEERLKIDTALLGSSIADINLSGVLSATGASDLGYRASVNDISSLREFAGAEVLEGRGTIEGRLHGLPDSLIGTAKINASGLKYNDISVGSLSANTEGSLIDSVLSFSGWLRGEQIERGGLRLDSVNADADYSRNIATVTLSAFGANEFAGSLNCRIFLDSVTRINPTDLSLRYEDLLWKASDLSLLTIDSGRYNIDNFILRSEEPNGAGMQTVGVDGTVDPEGESDLTARVENLSLAQFGSIVDLPVTGTLNSDWRLSGKTNNPTIHGNLVISSGKYSNFDFERLDGNFDYSDQRVNFSMNLKPTQAESLMIAGSAPFVLDTTSQAGVDSTIDVRIITDSLSLDVLKAAGYVVNEAEGYIQCALQASNTLSDPKVSGNVRVRKGALSIPVYGINYTDMEAGIGFAPGRTSIDSVVMTQNGGKFRLSGEMTFDGGLVSGEISSSRFELATKDFYLVRHKHYEVQVTSDARLEGADEPTYSGTITVNRSNLWLPAIMTQFGQSTASRPTTPMLVKATRPDSLRSPLAAQGPAVEEVIPDTVESKYMEDLRGTITVTIPKNTWIRSPDMKLEVSGNIDVVKEGPDFELFGSVNVVRGQYSLYGKKFTIKQGQLSFQGGKDYVANLDIEAGYVFRTAAKEKKTLHLLVTGTSETPQIRFTLDETEISEGDAMAYIVFGRSLDELTQGQRSSVVGENGTSAGAVAGGVAAKLLAGQLAQALGNELNLDVIEVKAEGDLQSASVVIGKYLTPDLFMSYERSFGASTDNDLEPETVTLEYQLTRLIYLQLTEGDPKEAGFDVILKFERE
ncbi:MAG: translocation/assembly module TamB domain-containing protein [Candidatus Zixiibacteriota bacterium]